MFPSVKYCHCLQHNAFTCRLDCVLMLFLCIVMAPNKSAPKKKGKSTEKKEKSNEMNFDAMFHAVKACVFDNKGIRLAAREFGIDKSSLARHKMKILAHFDDVSKASDTAILDVLRDSHKKIPTNQVCFSAFSSL